MNQTQKEGLQSLATENGLNKDHFFKSPQGFVIITRQGIERIQAHKGIRVRYEMVHLTDDCKFVVIKAIGEMSNGQGLPEKAAELLTGQRTEIFGKALDWGNEYEPICKAYYSELRGVTIEEMPFVEINDYSGASPDGMVDGELIEIKCPYNTANHLKTAFEGYIDPKYLWQMQGQMLATGATACRFISFDPRIKDERFKLIEIRVEADAEMQEQLRERLAFANDYLRNLLNP
jgi:hypothetical protein